MEHCGAPCTRSPPTTSSPPTRRAPPTSASRSWSSSRSRAFLDERGLGDGEIAVEPVGEGHSNVTFVIRAAAGGVIRRPPRGPLPPSAHDVLREARVLSATAGQARVPRVLATCDDEAVIGAPFYVMEHVEGHVVTQRVRPSSTPPDSRRMGEELIDALVEMHAVDWQACGLEGFGRPTGYRERQLRRFNGLWDHNRTREMPASSASATGSPHLPESGPATLVHGDFRLGNTMVGRPSPAARRDLRLGDGDRRRPARRPRLPLHAVGRPRRPAVGLCELSAVTRQEGFPSAPSSSPATRRAAGAR